MAIFEIVFCWGLVPPVKCNDVPPFYFCCPLDHRDLGSSFTREAKSPDDKVLLGTFEAETREERREKGSLHRIGDAQAICSRSRRGYADQLPETAFTDAGRHRRRRRHQRETPITGREKGGDTESTLVLCVVVCLHVDEGRTHIRRATHRPVSQPRREDEKTTRSRRLILLIPVIALPPKDHCSRW